MSNHEERFASLTRVYGTDAVAKLSAATVTVVGIGGVGTWVVEGLVRSAVGRLRLVDGDTISRSNTNRQIHTMESTLGRQKAGEMAARCRDINPDCVVDVVASHLDEDNLVSVLDGSDAVVDAIDNYKMKAAIINHCRRNKITLVTTGGAGGLIDPSMISVADLAKTWNDPLAAKVRSWLRYRHGFSGNPKRRFGVPCVYSTEQRRYPEPDGGIGHRKPGVAGVTLDCDSGYGASTSITAIFGFQATAKVIELLLR